MGFGIYIAGIRVYGVIKRLGFRVWVKGFSL